MVSNQLVDIHRTVGRIEGTLDSFIEEVRAERESRRVADAARDLVEASREKRLRKVENRQAWYAGAGAAVGAILGALGVHLKT